MQVSNTPNKPTTIIGSSPLLVKALAEADAFARSTLPILITGESGVGKQSLAERIHASSMRAGTLVQVNCGAIPESLAESIFFGHVKGAYTGAVNACAGIFKEADLGTLFLDEIGELSLPMQVKLLRVLDSNEFCAVGSNRVERVDVRIIAATNRDLWIMVQSGKFREDLYWRIHGAEVGLPALHERGDDILTLARHFIIACRDQNKWQMLNTLSDEVCTSLHAHTWTGNIRELRNVIGRACILAGEGATIEIVHLPRGFMVQTCAADVTLPGLPYSDIPEVLEFTIDDFDVLPDESVEVMIGPEMVTVNTAVTLPAPPPTDEVGECQIVYDLEPIKSEDLVEECIPIKSPLMTIDDLDVIPDDPSSTDRQYFDNVPIFVRPGIYIKAWRGMNVRNRTSRLLGCIEDVDSDGIAIVDSYQRGEDCYLWRMSEIMYAGMFDASVDLVMSEREVTAYKDGLIRAKCGDLSSLVETSEANV